MTPDLERARVDIAEAMTFHEATKATAQPVHLRRILTCLISAVMHLIKVVESLESRQ